jgi:DNA-binding LytR/AlgR family response regulator
MTALRVLIVDDEPLALDRMADLLGQIEGVEIVGSAATGSDGISSISALQPDLVLLDVEMPKVDGFDVVENLLRQTWPSGRPVPLICFVTAYPQFALEAFDTGALDFLCKPVRLARLERTVARARVALGHREATKRLHELSGQLDFLRQSRLPQDDRNLWVNQRGTMIRIDLNAIDWIEAEGEYAKLHVGTSSYLVRTPISYLTSQLENEGFVRIHRSATINRARLQGVRASRQGVTILLTSGTELSLGRTYRHVLKSIKAAANKPRAMHHSEKMKLEGMGSKGQA